MHDSRLEQRRSGRCSEQCTDECSPRALAVKGDLAGGTTEARHDRVDKLERVDSILKTDVLSAVGRQPAKLQRVSANEFSYIVDRD
jgi:hypothetical protein